MNKFYYLDGMISDKIFMDKPLHRLDGPAIDNYNGITGYFINDEHVSKEDFYNHPEVVAYKVGNIIKDILSGS